jgi:phage repressor protein C with HTH and peptisase S24 domain
VPKGQKPVPIFGSVPAGNPNHNFSQAEDVEFMPDDDPDALYFGTFVDGDSMNDMFRDGDRIIFEERQPLPNQFVYAFKGGEETFKLLKKNSDGSWELWPLNDVYEPLSAEGWQIRGVLRRVVRRERGMPTLTLDFAQTYTAPRRFYK